MPTIKHIGPYRIFFYAGDKSEPPHVHVERENKVAKFWIDPVHLQSGGKFRAREIKRIQRIVMEHQKEFLEAWNDYFRN